MMAYSISLKPLHHFLLLSLHLVGHINGQTEGTGQVEMDKVKGSSDSLNSSTDFSHHSFFADIQNDLSIPYPKIVGHTFETFDANKNRVLCIYEFSLMCRSLFQNEKNVIYPIKSDQLDELYGVFDVNHDDRIDVREFRQLWDKWISTILKPKSAYIVIDVQNDFVTGSLAVHKFGDHQDGATVIEPTNRLANNVKFDKLYYSLDFHPSNHISFIDNIHLRKLDKSSTIQNPDEAKVLDTVAFAGDPPITQILWPSHCVQKSWGAELHPNLTIPATRTLIYKGMNPEIDSYSALFDNGKLSSTTLVTDLKDSGITDCYFSGLAYDVCVASSANDASDLGYRTIIIDDASKGISLKNVEKTKEKVKEAHGLIVQSDQVEALILGKDRRPELAIKLALEIKKNGLVLPD